MPQANQFKWWTGGDLDGFFGLFIDNIIQLILIAVLCKFAVGLPDELVIGRILPGVAVSLLIGNIFYALQAKKLALKTGKMVTALPYGINTVSLFAYVLFVMKPVMDQSGDADLAWKVGLIACFASGVIELGGAFVVGWIKKVTPRAALLATLAGIAITFISMDFCFRIFADPIVGLVPLAFIFMQYIGRAYLPANIPAGLVAVIIGTALAWSLGRMDGAALSAAADISLQPPIPYPGDLFGMLTSKYLIEYLPVIIPMGLFNLLGSMQNLESAEAAGDRYEVKSSLAANGIGTIAASIFGSTFPTTIYIGHPGWKRMGAGAGYSVLNGVVITLICFLGLVGFITALVPVEAGAAILLWIGAIIAAQAFQATPREHAIAVVVGFFPALAAWGLLMMESGLRAAGTSAGMLGIEKLSMQLPISGMIALERGFIFTSMILAAMTVALVEKRYRPASIWAFVAAVLSATGLIHGFEIVGGSIVNAYGPSHTWPFIIGYTSMALIFLSMGGKKGEGV